MKVAVSNDVCYKIDMELDRRLTFFQAVTISIAPTQYW